jgi:NADPH:quinone reductase-like Zn-dependent oxidoreductase
MSVVGRVVVSDSMLDIPIGRPSWFAPMHGLPTTYRAMAQPRAGDLRLDPISLSRVAPGPGEVEIRVHAAAMNPADLHTARGWFSARAFHAPTTPLVGGHDFAGVVARVGEGVDRLDVGDHVFGFLPYSPQTRGGSFAEYVVAGADQVRWISDHVSSIRAAAAATPGITAIQALRDCGRLQSNQRVLIIGAAGGVGSLAIGIAKRLCAHVTAVAGTNAIDFVREVGADDVVDRDLEEVRALASRFHVIFDCAAAYTYGGLQHLLEPGGTYVTTRQSLGVVTGRARSLLSSRRCRMVAVSPVREDLDLLGDWLEYGLRVPIDARYSIRDLASAYERMERGGMRGRIAIDVADGF